MIRSRLYILSLRLLYFFCSNVEGISPPYWLQVSSCPVGFQGNERTQTETTFWLTLQYNERPLCGPGVTLDRPLYRTRGRLYSRVFITFTIAKYFPLLEPASNRISLFLICHKLRKSERMKNKRSERMKNKKNGKIILGVTNISFLYPYLYLETIGVPVWNRESKVTLRGLLDISSIKICQCVYFFGFRTVILSPVCRSFSILVLNFGSNKFIFGVVSKMLHWKEDPPISEPLTCPVFL